MNNKILLGIGILAVIVVVYGLSRSGPGEPEVVSELASEAVEVNQADETAVEAGEGEEFNVVVEESVAIWQARKRVGAAHQGTIDFKSGVIELVDGKLSGGEFVVDMTSIKDSDLDDETMRIKLENDLRSERFFDANEFPTARLTMSRIDIEASGLLVGGELTIRGITKPVTFAVNLLKEGNGVKMQGQLVFDRADFDVKFGSGRFFENLGDNLIEDEVTVDVVIVAK